MHMLHSDEEFSANLEPTKAESKEPTEEKDDKDDKDDTVIDYRMFGETYYQKMNQLLTRLKRQVNEQYWDTKGSGLFSATPDGIFRLRQELNNKYQIEGIIIEDDMTEEKIDTALTAVTDILIEKTSPSGRPTKNPETKIFYQHWLHTISNIRKEEYAIKAKQIKQLYG